MTGLPDPDQCPIRMKESLIRYRDKHCPTGGFLRAVLENDLMMAVSKADLPNLGALHHIVAWIYNYMPRMAHGSPEKVERWLEATDNG